MKTYTKLKLPKDSAWDRKTWRSYTPHWFNNFVTGITNIVRWIPVLYKDRDWDDSFTLKMLQRKIEHQRKYLVEANRHTRVDEDNYWMTTALNLIERELDEHYALEQYSYMDVDIQFVQSDSRKDSYEMKSIMKSECIEEYLHKYPAAIRRVMKVNETVEFIDKEKLAFYVARYNQDRCRKLLYKVLERYSNRWWD